MVATGDGDRGEPRKTLRTENETLRLLKIIMTSKNENKMIKQEKILEFCLASTPTPLMIRDLGSFENLLADMFASFYYVTMECTGSVCFVFSPKHKCGSFIKGLSGTRLASRSRTSAGIRKQTALVPDLVPNLLLERLPDLVPCLVHTRYQMVLDELAAFEQTASQGAGGMGEAFR